MKENKEIRSQYSDHNSIITNLEIKNNQEKVVQSENINTDSWVFTKDGWSRFHDITSTKPCHINELNDMNQEYTKLEEYIKHALNHSFTKRSNKKRVSP